MGEGIRKLSDYNKYSEFFDTETLSNDLRKRSIRGGVYTMVGQGITSILRVGSIAILARILIPDHFGLVSMVTALTVIAERFKDLGLSTATVQRKEITHEQVSTLFWINVGLGALIMVLVSASSGLISWFYGDDRLVRITVGISLTFLFGGMTIQHQAILRRRMEFFKISAVTIGGTLLSVIVAIMLAIKGYGYWALVWKEITNSVFVAVGTWLACPWVPALIVRKAGIGKMIRFGRDVTGFNLLTFLALGLDQILIGKFCGANLLGIYRQAYQLILTPVGQLAFPVQYVAEPALSLLQINPIRYRKYYSKIVTILSMVSMPVAVFLFLHSEDIILVLLGEKWIEAVQIFRILAISAFILPVASTPGFVMVTLGKTKRYFLVGLSSAIIFIVAFSIGIKWGALGIAIGYVLATYISVFPGVLLGFRETPVSVGVFVRAMLPSAICSVAMGGALLIFSSITSIESCFGRIGGALPIGVVAYSVAWMLIPGGVQRSKELFADLGFMFKKSGRERTVGIS
jgi:PST family polysaccharide transporter